MKFFKYITIIATVGVLGSCSLDQTPHDEISLNQAFSGIGDVRAWKVGMYGTLRKNIYGRNMMISDIQSDMLNATVLATDEHHLDFHRWETLTTDNAQLLAIWSSIYSAIADINVALNGLQNVDFSSRPEHQKELLATIGELRLARAYYNLYLATHFCKPYKASSANTDLGIPILSETKISRTLTRNTLEETYEHILEDIAVAETNLRDWEYGADTELAPFNTFFIEAGQMLKARTLLYMERWQEAYDMAQILIADPDYSLVTSPSELKSMWHNDAGSESITQLKATATESPQPNNLFLGHYAPQKTPWVVSSTPWYVPSQWVVDLYEPTDFRRNVYLKSDRAVINIANLF